jgi:hypothetical protein
MRRFDVLDAFKPGRGDWRADILVVRPRPQSQHFRASVDDADRSFHHGAPRRHG